MNILITKIKPNTYNPNEMTDVEFKELVQEVKHLGKPPKPIILRNKGDFFEIVDGEHSYKALKELGHQEVLSGWYEIVDFDDVEARRQTYKRNLGGKNNPIKLGLMIDQALEESKLSNRKLAEQWEVSEGMIRNYLLYAEVGKLRNDYANLAKCSVDQIRTYLKIAEYAKPIADYWFSCGGQKDALVVLDEAPFDKADYDVLATFQKLSIEIMKHNYHTVLPLKSSQNYIRLDLSQKEKESCINEFKTGFNRALNVPQLIERMRRCFVWEEGTTDEYILEYLAIYYDFPRIFPQHWIYTTFSIAIRRVNNQYEFLLTPEELRECMQYKLDREGFSLIRERLKKLIKNKHNIPEYQIKETSEPLETKLNRLEVETIAPEYIKDLHTLPLSIKQAFLNISFDTDEIRKETWELFIKNYSPKDFNKINYTNSASLQEKIMTVVNDVKKRELRKKEQDALRKMSEQELIEVFITKLDKVFKGDEKVKKALSEKMTTTFSRELLYLFVYLANKYYVEREWQEWIASLRSTFLKQKKGGESI